MSDTSGRAAADLDSRPHSAWAERLWLRLPSLLNWDGLLPLIAPSSTMLVSLVPGWLGLGPLVAVFVPILVALARAAIAQRQIERACGDGRTFLRQIVLAMAIVLLLFLEITTSALILANAPLKFWAFAAIVYVAYFGCISYALRRPATLPVDDGRLEISAFDGYSNGRT
jgi:hypothetical protein